MKINLKEILDNNYNAIEEGLLYTKYIEDIYLDYANNCITLESFAEDYLCTEEQAKKLIEIGRFINRLEAGTKLQ